MSGSRLPALAIAGLGLAVFLAAAALSSVGPAPEPAVHDEFSYLLAADTFASGRLTNPTHPLHVFFEAEHVIHEPSYASKYPPGQGLVLAFGQVVFGRAIAGSWLAAALAVAATAWLLLAWLPLGWALAGGLLVALHPLTIEWSQEYWGGLVALAGGSLVLGAFARLVRAPRVVNAVGLGAGLVVLAATRPYEGLLLGAPLGLALLGVLIARRPPRALRRVVLPLGLVLAAGAAWLLYYNARVTGDPFTLPYQVHERAYGTTPSFAFQDPVPIPSYRHEILRRFHVEFERHTYELRHAFAPHERLADVLREWIDAYWRGSLPALLAVVLALAFERSVGVWFAAFVLAFFLAGLSLATFVQPHYAAAGAGLAVLLVLRALRRLAGFRWRGTRVGGPCALVVLSLVFAALVREDLLLQLPARDPNAWNQQRARLLRELEATGERHLVIVRYSPRYSYHDEWVYNRADIDGAPVVWAREMRPGAMGSLLGYFAGRRVWRLEADAAEPVLAPYTVRPTR